MKYLLDTTLVVDLAHGTAAARTVFESLFGDPNDLYTCDVVTAEALSGGDDDHRETVVRLLDVLEYVSTIPDAARRAGQSRRSRGSYGRRTLGDALIGGVAQSLGANVVTRNTRDFVQQGIPVLAY
ncbi:MAG: type II toxin-antitoxin system VapC family toxin [Candidatus Limnocylindrales bacterium]